MDIRKRALLILALISAAAGLYALLPGVRLRAKHDALLDWAQNGAPSDFGDDFAHPDYRDAWHDSADAVMKRMRAVRFAFPALTVAADEPEIERTGGSARVTQKLEVSGAGERRSAQAVFTWERTSWLPWSWRLRAVEAPDLEL